jgi:putative chitinase
MKVTKSQLTKFFNKTSVLTVEPLADDLNHALEQYSINTPRRVAAFLAQVDIESGGLRAREENLNYSAKRLMEVFPRHFRDVDVNQYDRHPPKIANRVYRNRMGNGPEESGDGWRYRGRGFIQLTGKNNYTAFGKSMGMTPEEASEYMSTAEGAFMSAGWFWETNKLNTVADRGNIDEVSRIINAGPGGAMSSVHGLDKRRESYKRALEIFD